MVRIGGNPQADENDFAARVDAVVEAIIQQEQAGNATEEAEIERRYPELMPDLRDRLHTLRAIRAAAAKAKTRSPLSDSGDCHDAAFENDREWLNESLAGFEILERLDHGGQGVVYRAVQTATRRIVAIKVLLDGPLSSQRQRHRFAREVDLISQLRHPNIVTLYESGDLRGRQYFTMEYVDGLPIHDYFLLHRPSADDRVRLFSKVCRAVSHAHQRGIIHRDLKPTNILVDADGEPHILDFGLAKCIDDAGSAGDDAGLSITGQVFGTLPYLSPEQAGGRHGEVDVRSDIYALGIILYRLLTGMFPYPVKGDQAAVRANILTHEPLSIRRAMVGSDLGLYPTPDKFTNDLERVVFKAMSKDKSRRYQSADAFADDLDRYLAGDAVHAKADSRFYVLRKAVGKYRMHTTIAGAFLILLIGAVVGMAALWQRAERIAQVAQAGLQMGSILKTGSVARDEGRLAQAVAMYEKTIEIGESIPNPDAVMQRFLYSAHHGMAELYSEENIELDKADLHCGAAIRIAEAHSRSDPADPEWRRLLGFSFVLRGRMALSRADCQRAHEDFARAASIHAELRALDPANASHTSELAFTLRFQGRSCQKLGQMDEALRLWTRAHGLYADLLAADPDALDFAIEASRTEVMLAEWHLRQKTEAHDRLASEWHQRAEDHLDRLETTPQAKARRWDIESIRSVIDEHKGVLTRRAEKRLSRTPIKSDR